MKYFQAIVLINNAMHVHSQLFDCVDKLKEEIKKNKAYTLIGVGEFYFKETE